MLKRGVGYPAPRSLTWTVLHTAVETALFDGAVPEYYNLPHQAVMTPF